MTRPTRTHALSIQVPRRHAPKSIPAAQSIDRRPADSGCSGGCPRPATRLQVVPPCRGRPAHQHGVLQACSRATSTGARTCTGARTPHGRGATGGWKPQRAHLRLAECNSVTDDGLHYLSDLNNQQAHCPGPELLRHVCRSGGGAAPTDPLSLNQAPACAADEGWVECCELHG
jgi:hypothetical protein